MVKVRVVIYRIDGMSIQDDIPVPDLSNESLHLASVIAQGRFKAGSLIWVPSNLPYFTSTQVEKDIVPQIRVV